jgi:hypothetical protein
VRMLNGGCFHGRVFELNAQWILRDRSGWRLAVGG